jgi:hypothetical protein
MGLMVDTNVFIRFEKSGKSIDFSSGMAYRFLTDNVQEFCRVPGLKVIPFAS